MATAPLIASAWPKTKLEAALLEKYGALMSFSDLAELLGSTSRRISNGFANNLPWCRPFRRARIKIGRRVHLNTATVAEILEEIQKAGPDFCVQQGKARS